MITATQEALDRRTSRIKHVARFDGKVILPGMGEGLTWNMAISEQTEKMLITASGEQMGSSYSGRVHHSKLPGYETNGQEQEK